MFLSFRFHGCQLRVDAGDSDPPPQHGGPCGHPCVSPYHSGYNTNIETSHQKDITCISNIDNDKFATGYLDGTVLIYDTNLQNDIAIETSPKCKKPGNYIILTYFESQSKLKTIAF